MESNNDNNHRPETVGDDLARALRKIALLERRIEFLEGWNRWLAWALDCGLEPVAKAARMVRDHLWGIVNAVILRATNG